MIRALVALLICLISCGAQAQFLRLGASSSTTSCLYIATQNVDGCTGAPTANSLTTQHSTFFSGYAQQVSQTWPSGAGNTGAGNPGYTAPHPPWNVAGVDYPTGPKNGPVTPGTDSYDRNPDAGTPGYGLKLMTQNNFTLDGIYGAVNGCSMSGVRILCNNTMPNNPSHCPTTAEGNNCVIFDGYDFTNHATIGSIANDGTWFSFTSSLVASKVIIKNSYIALSTQSWALVDPYIFRNSSPVTIMNNKIDGGTDLTRLLTNSNWSANNNQIDTFFSFATSNLTFTDNADCGVYTVAICIQYNTFLNAPIRQFGFNPTDCTAACMGFVSQFNYTEAGAGLSWAVTGYIDNGLGAGGAYSGVAGNCLTITSFQGGVPFTTGTANTSAYVLTPYSNAGTPALNTNSTLYNLSRTSCNASFPTSSFTLSNSAAVPVPPGTIYISNGIHGDPYFALFAATTSNYSFPEIMGAWINQYNATLFPKNTIGTTGQTTWNTTSGTILKKATLNNCSPTCATSVTAGHTLNIPDTASYANNIGTSSMPSSNQSPANSRYFAIGQVIPGSDAPYGSSPFPAGGLTITGSADNAATCDNGPCTGAGTTGTYLVSGTAAAVSYNSTGMELAAVKIATFKESHNIYINNTAPLLSFQAIGGSSTMIGNNHAVAIGSLTIDSIFYDPTGANLCMFPVYTNTPSPLTITNNVNLLGNGSGQYDPNTNTSACFGRTP